MAKRNLKNIYQEYRERLLSQLSETPIYTSVLVLFVLAVLVATLSWQQYQDGEFYYQLLVEAHGMLFDIAIIGILIFWLNKIGEQRQRIRTYLDEIDDFRLWTSEEAAFRTAGNIKRLNRHGITELNLAECFLARTNLNDAKLELSNLNSANLSQAVLVGADLRKARLNRTNFNAASLNQINLENSYANGANFQSATLIRANMQHCSLIMANLENAVMMEANLQNCDLSGANLKNCNLFKADLRNAIGLTSEQLGQASNLSRATIDKALFLELQQSYPDLVSKAFSA